MTLRLILAGLALASLACADNNPRISVLWTDIPEIAGYTEVFNASQKEYMVMVEYQADSAAALVSQAKQPDLVMARGLTGRKVRSLFSPLNFLFERAALTREQFYPDFLRLGLEGDRQLLVPISFDAPVLVYSAEGPLAGKAGQTMELAALRQQAKAFNPAAGQPVRRLGFSPRWSPEFLMDLSLMKGVGWGESFSGEVVWDQGRLQDTLAWLRDWIDQDCLGLAGEAAFTAKYLASEPFGLVRDQRILVWPSGFAGFHQRPAALREGLDITWPMLDQKIPVSDDLVFAGIPGASSSRGASEAFLAWLLREDVQKNLLETARSSRLNAFGLAGGLSALHRINEQVLPALYPNLVGRIPAASLLDFPENLPPAWSELKAQVLVPWMTAQVTGKPGDSLTAVLEKWYLARTAR